MRGNIVGGSMGGTHVSSFVISVSSFSSFVSSSFDRVKMVRLSRSSDVEESVESPSLSVSFSGEVKGSEWTTAMRSIMSA